ncbi:MAG: right-handed parallel beta-helix repeat-containing protein [Candidatus Kerfeldbacteria bacterium]|nr:right-handed parallel beta-helix repeat-containing protein [Candidatus Kerfeldbacteria bacterium]
MRRWLQAQINSCENSLRQSSHGIGYRLLLALILLGFYIMLACQHALAALFLPPQESFEHFHPLDQTKGYQASYIAHRRWKHNLRFGTLSYSLVLVTSVIFVTSFFRFIVRQDTTPQVLAASLVVNSANDDNDGSCDSAPGDCTLREALAVAAASDVITFSGNTAITLTSTLNATAANLLINGSTNTVELNCNNTIDTGLSLNATNITVNSITIKNCTTTGLAVGGAGGGAIIRGVTLESNQSDGITLSATAKIDSSTITGNNITQTGINFGAVDNVVIKNTTFSSINNAISIAGGENALLGTNTFTDCGNYCIFMYDDAQAMIGYDEDGTSIRPNTFTSGTGNGAISVIDGTGTYISINTFSSIEGNTIYASGADDLTINGNTFTGTSGADIAINLQGVTNSAVEDNTIQNFTGTNAAASSYSQAIRTDNGSSAISIVSNIITNVDGIVFSIHNTTNTTVTGNSISAGNSHAGIQNDNSDSITYTNNTIEDITNSGLVVSGDSDNIIIGATLLSSGSGNTFRDANSAVEIQGTTFFSNVVIRENTFNLDEVDNFITYTVGATAPVSALTATLHTADEISGTGATGTVVDVYGRTSATGDVAFIAQAEVAADNWRLERDLSSYHTVFFTASTSSGTARFVNDLQPTTSMTLSDIAATTTSTTATITWTTTIAGNTKIGYTSNVDLTNPTLVGNTTESVTSHSYTITDLSPNTTYYHSARSDDTTNALNYADTGDTIYSFTTLLTDDSGDVTAPVLSNTASGGITANEAVITWSTDELATSQVEYGTTDSYGEIELNDTLVKNHSLTLTGLEANTTYHYRIVSVDEAGNTAESTDQTFTTLTKTDADAEAVVTDIRITDGSGNTITTDNTTAVINLQRGDLTFAFDGKAKFIDQRVHLVIDQINKNKQNQAKEIYNRKEAFTKKQLVEFNISKDLLKLKERYKVYTGLVAKNSAAYTNPSGLQPRFNFTVVSGPPTIITPATIISYGMPEQYMATTVDTSVTFTVTDSAGNYVHHCVGETVDNVASCQPPFGLTPEEFTLTAEGSDGGTTSQVMIISGQTDTTFVTDSRSNEYWNRITYTANPTFTGITTAKHTIAVRIPGIDGDMMAVVAPATDGITTWQFSLQLVQLPIGVTYVTIIDRDPAGNIISQLDYPVFRTHRPVDPAVIDPADHQRFALFAPIITVLGPNDHQLEVFNNDRLIYHGQYSAGKQIIDLSEFITKLGEQTIQLRNRNSLGLRSRKVDFNFTTYRPKPVVVSPEPEPEPEPVTPTETPTDSDNDGVPDTADHDNDNDGVDNITEQVLQTNPDQSDTDNDGLTDGLEQYYGTDPTVPDTDGDTVNDGTEQQQHTNPIKADNPDTTTGIVDTDGDGLADSEEPRYQTDPTDADTDDDNLSDGDEVILETDPIDADTDDDSLNDGQEITLGTNPSNNDTDVDGSDDANELVRDTNPLDPDSDDDGLVDGDEATDCPDPNDWDSDDDSIADGDEAARGTLACSADSDGDGVADNLDVIVVAATDQLEQTLQQFATAAYSGKPTPANYPYITKQAVPLTAEQHSALVQQLDNDIKNTKVNIIPGEFSSVTAGQTWVVKVRNEIGISDILAWLQGGSITPDSDTTRIILSGDFNEQTDAVKIVRGQPQYVIITTFSTPVVKIAQADDQGRWTMTIPAELLAVGDHTVYASGEINGARGQQVEVARFVIQQENRLSNTTWLVIVNIGIALLAVLISIVLQLKKRKAALTSSAH